MILDPPISARERNVLDMRMSGKTFHEIGQALGNKSEDYGREIYNDILKKLRFWKKAKKEHWALIKASNEIGYTYPGLRQLFCRLERAGIVHSYKSMDRDKLLTYDGIGPRSADVISRANYIYWEKYYHEDFLPNN